MVGEGPEFGGKMKFSIVIPVYNVERCLPECLESLLAQTYGEWEAVCVDNGSSDSSGVILDQYAARDSRIIVMHEENIGVSNARNAGLLRCAGDYVTFLDGDDVYARDWLQEAARLIAESGADLVRMSCTLWPDGDSRSEVNTSAGSFCVYSGEEATSWAWKTFLRCGWSWLLFVRRDRCDFSAWCQFPSGMAVREDNIFDLQLIPHVRTICQGSYAGYYYRQRKGSAASRARRGVDVSRFLSELSRVSAEQGMDAATVSNEMALEILIWRGAKEKGDCADEEIFHQLRMLAAKGRFSVRGLQWKWRPAFAAALVLRTMVPIAIYAGFRARVSRWRKRKANRQ